jgi:hypothetical protein
MGSLCVMRPGFWSSFGNPALLSENNSLYAGVNYENRFNICELGTRTIGLAIPARSTSLGIIYSHFGYSDFRRSSIGLSCGMPLSENFSAGARVDYFFENTSGDYDNSQSVTCEAGIFFRPNENINIGIHIFNPVPNSLRKRIMPSSLRAGAGIKLSKVLFAGAEAEMTTARNIIIRTGFEYEPGKNIFLRAGFSSENTSFTFGLGYRLKMVMIDLGFATHEKLGITSAASLVFRVK